MRDPNPKVYNQGIHYLLDKGIAVQMFDDPIRKKIELANKAFSEMFGKLDAAEYLAIEKELLPLLSDEAIEYYCHHAGLDTEYGYGMFWDWLLDYGILQKNDKTYTLSQEGYVAFAKNTIRHCDAAVIQLLVRFSANTIFNTTGKQIEYREDYTGPAILIMEKVSQWAEKYIIKEQDRTLKNTEDRYIVPFPLLKEAIVNAIVHRDYTGTGAFTQFFISDDYLSFSNPTILKNTTIENLTVFRSKSNPTNPRLARLFLEARLMERSGSGMQTFSSAVPKPIYEYSDMILLLRFGYSNNNNLKLLKNIFGSNFTQTDFELYEFIRENTKVTRVSVANHFKIPNSTATYRLNHLITLKVIERIGPAKSKNTYYRIL